jgi:ORF6N domain-containing protein
MEISKIDSLIHVIRGQRVMLDRDLAALYGVRTKVLNQAVRRHLNRFPGDFMFQLTREETGNWRSQIVTSNLTALMGLRQRPLAFTEQGVAMLSSVLSSDRAVEINISIMRAFVKLRQAVLFDASLAERMEKAEHALEALESEQGEQAVAIHEVLAAFRRIKG